MYQDRVARLDASRIRIEVVRTIGAGEVRAKQPGERGLQLLAVEARRINVIGLSARGRLGFEACANRDDVFRFAIDAVGIFHHKPAFVIRRGF